MQGAALPLPAAAPLPRRALNWLDLLLIVASALGILLVGMAGYLAATGYSRPAAGGTLPVTLGLTLSVLAFEALGILGSIYVVGVLRGRLSPAELGLRRPAGGWTVRAVLLGLVSIILTGVIALAVQQALGRGNENPQAQALAPEGFTWFGAASILLLAGIIVPFAEELFFRGVLYSFLRGRWGSVPAALASAAVFGAAHGDPAVGAAAFVLGLILARVFERSHSLWPGVIIHAINNGVKVAVLYAFLAGGGSI